MAAVAPALDAARGRLAAIPYHWQVVPVVVLGSFMVVLNMTIVNVALSRAFRSSRRPSTRANWW